MINISVSDYCMTHMQRVPLVYDLIFTNDLDSQGHNTFIIHKFLGWMFEILFNKF